jgi:uracil-DNA glycosylase
VGVPRTNFANILLMKQTLIAFFCLAPADCERRTGTTLNGRSGLLLCYSQNWYGVLSFSRRIFWKKIQVGVRSLPPMAVKNKDSQKCRYCQNLARNGRTRLYFTAGEKQWSTPKSFGRF